MNGDGNGPGDPKTRKLLQKSSSDTVLAAVAGMSPEPTRHGSHSAQKGLGGTVRPHLDGQRRAALYRRACSSLASAGVQLAGGSPSLGGSSAASPAIGATAARGASKVG